MALRIILPSSSSKECSSKRQEVPSLPPDEAHLVFLEAADSVTGEQFTSFTAFFTISYTPSAAILKNENGTAYACSGIIRS